MTVEYSKDFEKSVRKLSGKVLHSVIDMIDEVKSATSVSDITDCKKIESLKNVYRIRVGNKRAFFVLHLCIDGDTARFEYLLSRGEAYDKKNIEKLRNRDT